MYCRAQLVELNQNYQEIVSLDAEVLAISTDDLTGAGYAVAGLGIQFPVLYDPEGEVVRQYGVFDLLNDGLAAPATFVLDKSGIIRWQFIGDSKSHRPSFASVTQALKELD